MVAATLSTGETHAEVVLGSIGFCTVVLVISPMLRAICRTQQVGQTKAYPYLAVLFNCAIWVVFGIPGMQKLAHGSHLLLDWAGVPLMFANCIGIVVELVYVAIIIRFSVGRRCLPVATLVVVVIGSGVVAILLFATHWSRTFVGHIAMYSGIAMYAIPVHKAYVAYGANDPAQIPVFQASASLANGVVWTAYACVNHVQAFVFAPSLTAVFCAGGQLILREWIKRKVARQAAAARRAAELELAAAAAQDLAAAAAERRAPAPQDLEAGLGGGGGGEVQDLETGLGGGGGGEVQDLPAVSGGGGVVQDLETGLGGGGGGEVQDLRAVSGGGGSMVQDLEAGGNEAALGMGAAGALALPADEVLAAGDDDDNNDNRMLVLAGGDDVENQVLTAAGDNGVLVLAAGEDDGDRHGGGAVVEDVGKDDDDDDDNDGV